MQSLPHWFRLLIGCEREAVILLMRPRKSKARHQNKFQEVNELSRWLQCDATSEKLTADLCSRKKRNPMSKTRRAQAQTSGGRLRIRQQESASFSSGRNEPLNLSAKASGGPLQSTLKEDDDIRNLLTPGVELNPSL